MLLFYHLRFIGRPFVKRFALCYRTVVCPVLSVTLVYCGQTAEWTKMKLGTEVGLGPGHIVLDMGYQLPLQRGTAPPNLRLMWLNDRPSQLLLSTCLAARCEK